MTVKKDMAFGDSSVVASDFGQMNLLSSQEMMETEGEFGPLGWVAYIGGVAAFLLKT